MKVKYFEETDTLYITFRDNPPVETRDLDENTLIDFDEKGRLCSMTIEHVRERVGDPEVKFEKIPA